jgi:translation initiation factor IF-2
MAVSEQQQQINTQKFLEAQERARKLISMDAKNEISKGKKASYQPTMSQSMGLNESSVSYEDYDDYESNEPQYLTEEQMLAMHNQRIQKPIAQGNITNTKLPSAILQAFKENPIDTSVLESNMGMESQTSVLDALKIKPKPKQKQVIVENTVSQQPQPTTMVDYSLIRTIVEESVKKYVGSLKKSLLNENKQQSTDDNMVLMKIGESFKFVTKNGDIFEARLVKKGNINEKKTKE